MSIFSVLQLIIACFQTVLFVLVVLFPEKGDPVFIGVLMLFCWVMFFNSRRVDKR